MTNRYKSAKNYTRSDYLEIDECYCGKRAFKYNDTTRNIFIAKCGTCMDEYDSKIKKWVKSKKQPCSFFCIYHGPRPVFQEVVKVIKAIPLQQEDPDKMLEEKLRLFFRFLFVSNHTSTLDEINLLVEKKLWRKPRLIYYFPTTALFMKESHRESFEDYRTRIFSKKIIDRSKLLPPAPVISVSQFISDPDNITDTESIHSNEDSDKESAESGSESDSESDRDIGYDLEAESEIEDDYEEYDCGGDD